MIGLAGAPPARGDGAGNAGSRSTPTRAASSFRTTRVIYALTGHRALLIALAILLGVGAISAGVAQTSGATLAVPKVTLGVDTAQSPKDVSVALQVLLLMTVLSLAPSLLIMTTAFTRIVIVLSIMRNALGLPGVPPNQVMIGLALFMTFFIMRPVFEQINDDALQPYFANKVTFQVAADRAIKPLRGFMIRQTYMKDLRFFVGIARLKAPPRTEADVPITVVIPAFITSELKTAFIMGFYIYLPFLMIDIVVSSTLMSMGMMMLPPTVISIPAKILLFVLANGWTLVLGSLVKGFR